MKVLKFGGSSVANPAVINKVISIVCDEASRSEDLWIVISAQSGITNQLVQLCDFIVTDPEKCEGIIRSIEERHINTARALLPAGNQPEVIAEILALCNRLNELVKGASLVGEVTPRTKDLVLSFGERLSASLMYLILKHKIPSVQLADSTKLIRTDSQFGNARVDFGATNRLLEEYYGLRKGVRVAAGFIAASVRNEITTLGRNGSDYSASIIGAALGAEAIEIWTDTDGVMTSDPALVAGARNIRQLTYSEAMELSHFGARIIFPASLQPAMQIGIPLVIKNTFNPSHPGTRICSEPLSEGAYIKGISSLRNISIINVEGCGMVGVAGIAARMFTALSAGRISVIMISQASSEHSICITVSGDEASTATRILRETFFEELRTGLISTVTCEDNLAIISVVGENMRNMPGVAARVFEPMGKNGINIKVISQGSSELNISFVVREHDLGPALNILHNEMFEKIEVQG